MIRILLSRYNLSEEIFKEHVSKYFNNTQKVTVIPFSFKEEWIANNEDWYKAYNNIDGLYYKDIVQPFIDLGIEETNITFLNYFIDTKEYMKELINNSDIVFLTGGLPDYAIERVIEKDLVEEIKNTPIVIGASAGAVMQLNDYYLSPDDDYLEFGYYKGLGLFKHDFQIEVHYANTDIQNECIERVLQEKTDLVYAITDQGAIIIEDDQLTLLGDVQIKTK